MTTGHTHSHKTSASRVSRFNCAVLKTILKYINLNHRIKKKRRRIKETYIQKSAGPKLWFQKEGNAFRNKTESGVIKFPDNNNHLCVCKNVYFKQQ